MKSQKELYNLALSLEKGLKSIELDNNDLNSEDVLKFLEKYDRAVGTFYKEKSLNRDQNKLKYFQEIIITTTHELLKYRIPEKNPYTYTKWLNEYRKIWLSNLELFYFTLCLFTISMIVGWNIGVSKASLVPVIIPQNMMEMIIDHNRWFSELQKDPAIGGLMIAINNIKVSVFCFLLGTLFGFGGILILCFNGILFGTMFGYCYVNGFHDQLLDFVFAHGFLELTIIIASCFAGLLVGKVYYLRPYKNFQLRLKNSGRDASIVATGVIPWLILAASIEGFISPFHYLSTENKFVLGLIVCISFLIWTFKPTKLNSQT